MKKDELARLARALARVLPSSKTRGPLLYLVPVEHVLRGVDFEGSDFDRDSVFMNAFFVPLFVPRDYLSLTFGYRIRRPNGADRWSSNEVMEHFTPGLVSELSSFFARFSNPDLIATRLAGSDLGASPRAIEAIAYALVLTGRRSEGLEALTNLIESLDLRVHWQQEMATRAETLRRLLIQDPEAAKQQLEQWEAETKVKLHVFE